MKVYKIFFLLIISFVSCQVPNHEKLTNSKELIGFPDPNSYICQRAGSLVNVDGILSDEEWSQIEWTDYFQDIEGEGHATPRYKTRAKMMWDDSCLYVAAELEEPNVWANIHKRDAVIFYDNDFEVFIDPDGDTHNYYELEVNALATAWDLLLTKPYRDHGHPIDSWDITDLKVGVSIDGSINNPDDKDRGWTVEIAIPFKVLTECLPNEGAPLTGDYWRINFSRVEWKVRVDNDHYVKLTDPKTGKSLPEDNWVWSPQDHINMHMPEYWGFIYFTDKKAQNSGSEFSLPEYEKTKWLLRNVYYQQVAYHEQFGYYAKTLSELGILNSFKLKNLPTPGLEKTIRGYDAFLPADENKYWIINEDGEIVVK